MFYLIKESILEKTIKDTTFLKEVIHDSDSQAVISLISVFQYGFASIEAVFAYASYQGEVFENGKKLFQIYFHVMMQTKNQTHSWKQFPKR